MRIASNTLSDSMIRQIQQLTGDQAKLQMQVSTGRRITHPEDDPTAVGRVLILQSEQRQLEQYANNAMRALTVAQTSFSGLQNLKKVSDRAGELATLGTGAMSADAMRAYGTEIDQMREQALQLANTRVGSDYIYAGTAVDAPAFSATRNASGQITAVNYDGNAAQAAIQLSEATSVAPTTTGATNAGMEDFLTHLVALRNALNAGDIAAVRAVQPGLEADEDMLISAMADNGGIQTRIEAAQSQQRDRATNLDKLVSSESSVDLPTTIVKLNQTQTAYQAALASAAKIMSLSLLDYVR
ncbi:MAG TPA: flagellar hook-associated protein FlgL [Opitutus sp.]|nr:flagellar hook-associated protein FlgL [Opitutus sp.]